MCRQPCPKLHPSFEYTQENLCAVVGEGDTEAKLRLQEEKIFDMKQQMSTMQQRIDNLKDENEELKIRHSLPPIKEEGIYMSCAHL